MIETHHPLLLPSWDVMDPKSHGTPTEVPCPKCGGQLVYNGNYFCVNARKLHRVESRDGTRFYWDVGCGWALSERPHRGKKLGKYLALSLDLITALYRTRKDERTLYYVALSAEEYLEWCKKNHEIPK